MGRNSCQSVARTLFCCLGITGQDNGKRGIFQRDKYYTWGKRSEFRLRRCWKVPHYIPPLSLSTAPWKGVGKGFVFFSPSGPFSGFPL